MSNNQVYSAGNAGTVKVGDFTVNRLGFGAVRITGPGDWGLPADKPNALAVLHRAVELGVNFIDTADSYGPNVSEELIAEALHPYNGLIIATKGGYTRSGPGRWAVNGQPEHLRQALEGSLQRLGVAQIQLYQLHEVDPRVPLTTSLKTLVDLKEQGKIRHIGLSNVSLAQLKTAQELTEIVSVQNHYNLSYRAESEEVVQYCEQQGIIFIPYYPVGGDRTGGFANTLLENLAARYVASRYQIALAWLLQHSPIILPIPGTTSLAHLAENIAASKLQLSEEDVAQLDKIGITSPF